MFPKNLGSILRLNHIAIAYPNAMAAAQFYRNVFGLPVSERQRLDEHGVSTLFVSTGSHGMEHPKLELLEPLDAHSPIQSFVERNPKGGIHHLCFEVPDLTAFLAYLESTHQIRPIQPVKIGAHGKPVAFLHPKHAQGLLIELEQA